MFSSQSCTSVVCLSSWWMRKGHFLTAPLSLKDAVRWIKCVFFSGGGNLARFSWDLTQFLSCSFHHKCTTPSKWDVEANHQALPLITALMLMTTADAIKLTQHLKKYGSDAVHCKRLFFMCVCLDFCKRGFPHSSSYFGFRLKFHLGKLGSTSTHVEAKKKTKKKPYTYIV